MTTDDLRHVLNKMNKLWPKRARTWTNPPIRLEVYIDEKWRFLEASHVGFRWSRSADRPTLVIRGSRV